MTQPSYDTYFRDPPASYTTRKENRTMQPHDVILVVDHDERYKKASKRGQSINANREAQGLTLLTNAFGRNNRRIALVSQHDPDGLTAYSRAGFETISINGNRPTELRSFIINMQNTLMDAPPRHFIVDSTDPEFELLCHAAAQNPRINLAVWAPAADVPPELTNARYNFRRLEDLLPDIKVPTVDVRLDYENLHIGLKQLGWKGDPKALVEAIKTLVSDLGNITAIHAYGDWDLLARSSGHNIQRELTLAGVKTRYQISVRGKNSADMEIADDIRTLVEKDSSAPDGVDVVCIGTRDRDFRPSLQTARARGKKVILVTFRDGLSRELKEVAGQDIRYLDDVLGLGERSSAVSKVTPDGLAELAMRIDLWLRRQGWKWAYTDTLVAGVARGPSDQERLRRGIDAGVFTARKRPGPNGAGELVETVMPNSEHPLLQAVRYMIEWVPGRVSFGLNTRKLPYIDSNYLANGMTKDPTCRRLGIGQDRQEADRWLDLAARVGLVTRKRQPHPDTPSRLITTWWLAEEPIDQATILRWVVTCADLYMTEHAIPWVPITTLIRQLGDSNRTAFQRTIDQLQANHELSLEQHSREDNPHPTTGVHLGSTDAPMVSGVRDERRTLLAYLRTLDQTGIKITQEQVTKRFSEEVADAKLDAKLVEGWLMVLQKEKVLRSADDDPTTLLLTQRQHLLVENDTDHTENPPPDTTADLGHQDAEVDKPKPSASTNEQNRKNPRWDVPLGA